MQVILETMRRMIESENSQQSQAAGFAMSNPRKVRCVVGWLLVACLLIWPAWSLSDMRYYLKTYQPLPANAQADWQMLSRRFALLRRTYGPGTVLAYQHTERTAVAPSRMHDVNFVCSPLVVTDLWYAKTDLVLADMMDDNELRDLIKREQLTVVNYFGGGLAVLRRPKGAKQ